MIFSCRDNLASKLYRMKKPSLPDHPPHHHSANIVLLVLEVEKFRFSKRAPERVWQFTRVENTRSSSVHFLQVDNMPLPPAIPFEGPWRVRLVVKDVLSYLQSERPRAVV
jgi:hypothetical protein